jgi:hypothetical protein
MAEYNQRSDSVICLSTNPGWFHGSIRHRLRSPGMDAVTGRVGEGAGSQISFSGSNRESDRPKVREHP